jgi:uncharacterized protein YcbK (DUF882 family)
METGTDGRLSEHFWRREFACKCGCGLDTIDAATLAVLELVRAHFEAPVTVASGHRCEAHNRACGGLAGSQHLRGRAADIVVEGVNAFEVYAFLDELHPHDLGLGRYATFTHVDTRTDGPARWSG